MTTESEMIEQKKEKKYLDAIFWGGALLWAGLVFGAETLGYLPQIGAANAWSWVFVGAGVYGLLMNIVRLASQSLSNPAAWDWIWVVIFVIIGAAGFFAINVPWWLFLIIIGVVILFGALFHRD